MFHFKSRIISDHALACLCVVLCSMPIDASSQVNSASFELRPGVLVDRNRDLIYVMSPDGGVVALNLKRGTEEWRTKEVGKPLTLAGKLLVGQAESSGPPGQLKLVTIDPDKKGAPLMEKTVAIRPDVVAAIDESFRHSFIAKARSLGEKAQVTWEYFANPLKGVRPGTSRTYLGESVAGDEVRIAAASDPSAPGQSATQRIRRSGAFQLDLRSGAVSNAAPQDSPVKAEVARDLPDVHAKGVPEPQFLSADGKHVLHSRRIADDSVWEKYLWVVFDREAKPLGEFRAPIRVAPFFVSGSDVIYETGPYARTIGKELVHEPLQIQAVDLSTGKTIWKQAIRDTTPRGAPPP
jgi:hypothetical protein